MQAKSVLVVTFAAAVLTFPAMQSAAQCNPSCKGDFDFDQRVTIDELVAAVGNALGSCEASPEQQGCLASGGTLSTAPCCSSAPDFPDTCGIGTCGCAPQFSREVPLCECGDGRCFDRDQRACVPPTGSR